MSPSLEPAVEVAARVCKPYPNDSEAHHQACVALLAEEIELRRHIERVSAQRRALPQGGEIPQDYVFVNEAGRQVRLSEMFGDSDTLVTYFWMFGPHRKRPCPMCTTMLGSIAANARDITQRAPLAILGRSPIEKQTEFKRERGWAHLDFFETVGDDFPRDYHGLDAEGDEFGAFNVFTKHGGRVRHFYGGEMGPETSDPGEDPRGAPDMAALWNILDLTPAGRGADWYPKLDY